jgi:hypothetical protein
MDNNEMETEAPEMDVFAAAAWLDSNWNSSAHAVSQERIEWQCGTWGSGRGRATWEETAVFCIVAEICGLDTTRNFEGRDELIVLVPLDKFERVMDLVLSLGENIEDQDWLGEEDRSEQIALAAAVLDMPVKALKKNTGLLELLRIG